MRNIGHMDTTHRPDIRGGKAIYTVDIAGKNKCEKIIGVRVRIRKYRDRWRTYFYDDNVKTMEVR